MKEIFYVTGNTSKFNEVNDFVKRCCPEIDLTQYHVELAEEQSLDQKAIAISKGLQAWEALKKPLLVDDAGFFFEKYPKFPGTLSKPVVQALGFEGILKFAQALDNDRIFHGAHVVYVSGENQYEVFQSQTHGTIIEPKSTDAPPGLRGYAYFLPDGSDKTYAQLYGTPEMDDYSYRIKAFKKFIEWCRHE